MTRGSLVVLMLGYVCAVCSACPDESADDAGPADDDPSADGGVPGGNLYCGADEQRFVIALREYLRSCHQAEAPALLALDEEAVTLGAAFADLTVQYIALALVVPGGGVDGDRLPACLAALAAEPAADCVLPTACHDIVVGSLALGESCQLSTSCVSGHCENDGFGQLGACGPEPAPPPPPPLGEVQDECSSDDECLESLYCHVFDDVCLAPVVAMGDCTNPDGLFDLDCDVGFYCDIDNVCSPRLDEGGTCFGGDYCREDLVCYDNVCSARLLGQSAGDPCQSVFDACGDAWSTGLLCVGERPMQTCAELVGVAPGGACDDDYAALSRPDGPRVCLGGLTTHFCDGETDTMAGTCRPRPAPGEPCDVDRPCNPRVHVCGDTAVCEVLPSEGAPCIAGECADGLDCEADVCIVPNPTSTDLCLL